MNGEEQKPGTDRLNRRTDEEPPGEERKLRKGMRNTLALLLAVCTLVVGAAGMAESMHREVSNDALDLTVSVGFDGRMVYGKAMPVRVKVRNFGDDFEGVLGLNAYISAKEYDRYEKEVFVPAGSEREFELAVSVYARQNTFTAELTKDGEVICAANGKPGATINPAAMLIGVLSTRPKSLGNLNISRDNDVLGRYEIWETIPLTADTFPDDASLLNSFGILAIDDIDPASLTQKQQGILENWLRSGRILLCGGGPSAAANTAYFAKYTGLKAENMVSSDTVLENLEELISRSASGKKPTCALAVYSGGEPLARDGQGTGLLYRTPVGGGRVYTAAFELGDARLNSEHIMGFFWQQLLVNRDQDAYTGIINSSSDTFSSATVNAGYSAQVEARSFLPAGMLTVAGMIILSCVIWAVLKKKDRRQWMWLVLPVTAVIAVAGILLISTGAETNRTLAVIADNLVQDSAGTVRDYCGIAVAAPEFGRHSYSVDGGTLRVQVYDYVDYDEEQDTKKLQEPTVLRTCYFAGGENAVTAESLTPWDQISLAAQLPAQIRGQISGSVWMEEDGLHGEVMNGTDARFAAGWLVTTYGYVSVPALAPGEKTEFVMTRKKFDSKTGVYEDGALYPDHPSIYSVINDAAGYNDPKSKLSAAERRDRELISSMVNGAADALRRDSGNWSYGSYESALFLFTARPENLTGTDLKADGVPVVQKTSLTMMTAVLPFTAVGRTGIVFRSAGMDIPERVETDENRMPTDEPVQNAKQTYYHSLSETPTFRFTMEGMAGVKIEKMQVLVDSYYANQCNAYALNAAKGEWEEIKLNEDISDSGRFLDQDGRIYLQFRNATQDMYADIATPLINLEGRLEHADN